MIFTDFFLNQLLIKSIRILTNIPILFIGGWWSPRLGHGAVLAASKPLQVSKYKA